MSSEKNLEISADPQTVQADHVEDVQGLEQEKLPWQSIAAIGVCTARWSPFTELHANDVGLDAHDGIPVIPVHPYNAGCYPVLHQR